MFKDIEYSKVPNKVKNAKSTEITEGQVQERDKRKRRRTGTPPPADKLKN